MSQNQPEQPAPAEPSAVARAEDLLNRAAHRIGFVAGRTRLRLQGAASAIRAEADRLDLPQAAPAQKEQPPATSAAPVEQAGQPATHKAEEMVDALGQRLGASVSMASFQVQKAAARLREEAEDIWAEARSISHRNDHPSQ